MQTHCMLISTRLTQIRCMGDVINKLEMIGQQLCWTNANFIQKRVCVHLHTCIHNSCILSSCGTLYNIQYMVTWHPPPSITYTYTHTHTHTHADTHTHTYIYIYTLLSESLSLSLSLPPSLPLLSLSPTHTRTHTCTHTALKILLLQ